MEAPAKSPTPPPEKIPKGECLLGLLLYGLTLVFFYPFITWVVQSTLANSQLFQAASLLLLVCFFLVYINRERFSLTCRLDSNALTLLALVYGALGLAKWTERPVFILVGFALTLASALHFLFGRKSSRVRGAIVGGICLYAIFIFLRPFTCWPLEYASGLSAGKILDAFGIAHRACCANFSEGPRFLIELENASPAFFPDCSGFGMISAVLLVAFVFVLYRKTPAFGKMIWVAWAGVLAFAVNVARILAIVLIPVKSQTEFELLHQTAGLAALYSAVLLLWFFLAERPPKRKPKETP